MQPSDYPLEFSVEYPDRELNRLSTFFRIITVIPIVIILGLLAGGGGWNSGHGEYWAQFFGTGVGVLFVPTALMILFRKKYPRWWYDWNLQLMRFANRVGIYFVLMDDRYPSTDEEQSVRLEFPYPDAEAELERGMPIIKWLLAIPHYIVLFVLHIGVFFAVIFAWFAILFTGRYPRGVFKYIEGVIRWHNRVIVYAYALTTDKYPPFRLSP
jgi:hypothetical protein